MQIADAVAPVGVLAEALPRSLVDAVRVADGRPGPSGVGALVIAPASARSRPCPRGLAWPPLGSNGWTEEVGRGRGKRRREVWHGQRRLPFDADPCGATESRPISHAPRQPSGGPLLEALRTASQTIPKGSDHRHRLHLTLLLSTASVPAPRREVGGGASPGS